MRLSKLAEVLGGEYVGGEAEIAALNVDSRKKVKNALLSEMPQLEWAGINTRGCLATISVKERSPVVKSSQAKCVGHIVALQDGVISNMITTTGTPLCAVGQAVKKGQVLVSGYTDCGLVLRAEQAEAEVLAVPNRRVRVRIPDNAIVRKEKVDIWTDCSIQIGKSVVKLIESKRAQETGAAKELEKHYLTLPGGFRLPVALVFEKYCNYTTDIGEYDDFDDVRCLVEAYLMDHMIMGRIMSSHYFELQDRTRRSLDAVLVCEEIIGQFRREGLERHNGK
jgi:hypothetical protein